MPLNSCRACDPKKGSQFAARLVARYRRSQFYYAIGLWPSLKREAHYNKNFVKSQINIIYILPQEWIIYFVLFLLISSKFVFGYRGSSKV